MAKLYLTLSLPTILFILCPIFVYSNSQTNFSRQNGKIEGLQFRMIHIDSPNSPLYQPKLTTLERRNRLLAMSDYRLYYLTKNTTQLRMSHIREPDMIAPQLERFGSVYYVEIGLGHVNGAPHTNYLSFDTGSDYTWTQCEGCGPCFHQVDPLFPWSRSSTYRVLRFNECPHGQWNQGHCINHIDYTDGGYMTGVMARERFTFTDIFFRTQSIDGLIFTCGLQISNFNSAVLPNNKITGLLGMGSGPFSLISQLGNEAGHQFSYCLQHHTPGQDFPTFLRFGQYVRRLPVMLSTPIETPPGKHGYYVGLTDISVNGRRLNIPEHLFHLKADNSGGTIIDSGAILSYINTDAYDILEAAIAAYVSNNNHLLQMRLNPRGLVLEVCWEPAFDSLPVNFPTLTYHFQDDADMLVQPDVLFQPFPLPGIPRPGMHCLTIKRTYDVNTIGIYHQANQLLIYDVGRSTLSFAAADCSHQG